MKYLSFILLFTGGVLSFNAFCLDGSSNADAYSYYCSIPGKCTWGIDSVAHVSVFSPIDDNDFLNFSAKYNAEHPEPVINKPTRKPADKPSDQPDEGEASLCVSPADSSCAVYNYPHAGSDDPYVDGTAKQPDSSHGLTGHSDNKPVNAKTELNSGAGDDSAGTGGTGGNVSGSDDIFSVTADSYISGDSTDNNSSVSDDNTDDRSDVNYVSGYGFEYPSDLFTLYNNLLYPEDNCKPFSRFHRGSCPSGTSLDEFGYCAAIPRCYLPASHLNDKTVVSSDKHDGDNVTTTTTNITNSVTNENSTGTGNGDVVSAIDSLHSDTNKNHQEILDLLGNSDPAKTGMDSVKNGLSADLKSLTDNTDSLLSGSYDDAASEFKGILDNIDSYVPDVKFTFALPERFVSGVSGRCVPLVFDFNISLVGLPDYHFYAEGVQACKLYDSYIRPVVEYMLYFITAFSCRLVFTRFAEFLTSH